MPLEAHLPGITGLLEYRRDSAQPIRELTQILLRGSNTLIEAERELVATVVSKGNQCRFCANAHAAAANLLLGENHTTEKVLDNISTAPVSEKRVSEAWYCSDPKQINIYMNLPRCY